MKRMNYFCFAMLFGFLLGIHHGYIALWKDESTEPIQIFPYKAENLPSVDQKALAHGIPLRDDSALAQLLEDYLS